MKLTRFCNFEDPQQLQLRDIDKTQGIITFYFATFGNKNSHKGKREARRTITDRTRPDLRRNAQQGSSRTIAVC